VLEFARAYICVFAVRILLTFLPARHSTFAISISLGRYFLVPYPARLCGACLSIYRNYARIRIEVLINARNRAPSRF
jgi:hypothetical protein